ncbi:MAG: stalk domain-containing protein [Armatimonadota bacterium]
MSLPIVLAATSLVQFNLLEGQPVKDEKLLRSLTDVVALKSEEIPGFSTKGGISVFVDLKVYGYNLKGVSLDLYQTLSRQSAIGKGKDEINILARLLPNRDIAYQVAMASMNTNVFFPGAEPGKFPKGSWTGLPIGEESWATAPKAGRISFTASLVVWDDRLVLKVRVAYPPLDPESRNLQFLPIAQEDLELGELAARLVLARAHLVLLGWGELPTVRLVANGKALSGKRTRHGRVFVPVQAVCQSYGVRAQRQSGVLMASWGGKRVKMPIGSRVLMVGKERVVLGSPVLWDGKEGWVEATGLAKGLGLAMRWERGQLVLAKR